jgi:hypothetical protein
MDGHWQRLALTIRWRVTPTDLTSEGEADGCSRRGTNVPRRGVAIVFDQLKRTVQIGVHQSIAPLVCLAPNVSLHRGEMN